MRLPIRSVLFALAALAPLVACSSTSSQPDGGTYTPPQSDASGTPVTTVADTGAPVVDSSVADTGTITGDAGACKLPTGGPTSNSTCNACLQTSCCTAVLTCLNDTACLDFNNCIAACQQGKLPNDGGSYDASAGDGGALLSCQTTCESGVSATVINEFQQQSACFNAGGPCVTACQ